MNERDRCQFCLGAKGGTPGNENNFNGVVVCDFCTILILKIKDGIEEEMIYLRQCAEADQAMLEQERTMHDRSQTVQVPPEIRARWQDILKAAGDIGGWFDRYTGNILADDALEDGMPSECPETIGYRQLHDYERWRDEHGNEIPTAQERDWSERGVTRPLLELHFGTFAIFRCTKEESALLNEGYEDTAGTDNERFVEDGDHVIVVCMM